MKYLSLLRGINVSGQKKIKMEDLRALYISAGLKDVQSYIQSGNLVFSTDMKDTKKIQTLIEDLIEKHYSFSVPVIIKTAKERDIIVEQKPFTEEKIYLTLFSKKPSSIPLEKIDASKTSGDKVKIIEDKIYFFCPEGYGKTKLSNNFFEKMSNTIATTRNRRTVLKLHEMLL